MKYTIKRSFMLFILFLIAGFFLYQVQDKVLAEQSGLSPESGVTSRIKTIYDSLVSLSHGSDSAGGWGNWGVMWNRIRSAAEWVPSGDATDADVVSGKLFYKNSRTQKTGTLTLSGDATAADVAYGKTFYSSTFEKQTGTYTTCGQTFQVNHLASGGVAPVDKTVTYGTVLTNIGGTGDMCWITQNLGANNQAASKDDSTEASAGWYWQFNRKQGYKHDGVTRTPATAWITPIDEDFNWIADNDPCALELGAGWRLPTSTEYLNMDSTGGWTNWNGPWNSVLKLHAAGRLHWITGNLSYRGSEGLYWVSTQIDPYHNLGAFFDFSSNNSQVDQEDKARGFPVRCLRAP